MCVCVGGGIWEVVVRGDKLERRVVGREEILSREEGILLNGGWIVFSSEAKGKKVKLGAYVDAF